MKYGLIGEKLSHSFSERVHNLLGNDEYEVKSIPFEKIDAFLIDRNFIGINITIPYKKTVIPYCDALSDEARAIGAVNTLVARGGVLTAHNTDCHGFEALAQMAGIDFAGKRVIILGSGGTSATVRYVAKRLDAREIVTISRQGDVTYSDLAKYRNTDIIVNTTPLGMFPNNGESPVNLDSFSNLSGVLDVVYNPLRTALIMDAKARGIPCAGGLLMLVAQAARASELFFDTKIGNEKLLDVYRTILQEKSNIILIGMPGCGKSTVGQRLAAKLAREFLDTDDMVTEREGRSIPDIFADNGEGYFREAEREAVADAGKRSGVVIAVGGGAVLRDENRRALRQNGVIVHIDRPLESLELGDGRPLSPSFEALQKMYPLRTPIYESFRDILVHGGGSADDTAEEIKKIFQQSEVR